MIEIKQDMPEISGLDNMVHKHGDVWINIDIDSVKHDIECLEEKANNAISSSDKHNIKVVQNHLKNLVDSCVDCRYKLGWRVERQVMKAYPVDLSYIPEYSIDMTDYIVSKDNNIVRIEYTDINEIIALELMFKDLGETMASMEDMLRHIGLADIVPSYELLKNFDDSIYMMSKYFKVGQSPYYASDKGKMIEYFGKKDFKSKYYREAVEFSIKHAMTIIAYRISDKLMRNGIKHKICGISASGVYFIMHKDFNDDKILNESVAIRAFGRQFEVKPKISIF